MEFELQILGKDSSCVLSERDCKSARNYLLAFVRSHDARSLWRLATKERSVSYQEAANLRTTLVDLFPQVAQWQVSEQKETKTSHVSALCMK